MTNVEIYDTSNSELSSDEYSQEEDDDALMEAAVSKQASPGTATIKAGPDAKPMSQPSEKPDDDGSPTAADAAGKDKVAEDASVVEQEPLPTPAETIRQIRQLDSAPYRNPYIFLKRRSLLGKHINQCDGKYQLHMKDKKSGGRRRRYSSSSRSLSYSRSNSRSLSRSRSRSRSLDRSGSSERSHSRSLSQSPELICLDDTENEDSPEKPEEAKAANVTPIKENKAKIIKPPPPVQPQLEQQENDKSNENGTSSVLEEFLMIKEPRQPSQAGIELDKLTAGLELEQATADTTLVQQDDVEEAEEPMAVDVTLKRRRSVTPPLSNEKRRVVDDEDDTIEFHPVVAQNSVESTPVLKMQPPRASNVASPAVNSLQSQPAFKLSSPYTLVQPSPNAKQPINLAALSHSLNTPTPPAVPMEISYPTDNLPHTTKSNIVVAPPEQPASSVTVPVYGCSPYASPLQWSQPAQVGHQRDIPAQNDPSRAAAPLQAAPSGALQAPFGTQRVLPAQVGTPRTPAGPTRISLQVNSPRPTVPQQAPPQHQPQAQMQQEQPQVPVNATNFAVPQQPQPRRSETVSTQTQAGQPESPRQKPSAPDLKNPNANFHHRLKELFPDLDAIFKEKLDSMSPDPKSFMEEIDLDIKTLDKLLAQKEDEWNRLLHLRCMKVELRGRMERMERVSIIKKLLPSVINKGCGTAELYELQESLFGEHIHKLPSRLASTSLEQCLNNVEVAQGDIQRLRG
ncbi:hypothetical protein KR059_005597 [Drosophila kikkawai]|nr:hypothetical protein KR059_005597 [Drosophila kikkawai]